MIVNELILISDNLTDLIGLVSMIMGFYIAKGLMLDICPKKEL